MGPALVFEKVVERLSIVLDVPIALFHALHLSAFMLVLPGIILGLAILYIVFQSERPLPPKAVGLGRTRTRRQRRPRAVRSAGRRISVGHPATPQRLVSR